MTALQTSARDEDVRRKREPPSNVRRQAALAWGAVTTVCVLALAIAYSATQSENFSDLTTGTMAWVGFGDKSIEIYGAALAVVLGALVGALKARTPEAALASRPRESDTEESTLKPLSVVFVLLLALASAVLGLRTVVAALGFEGGAWPWAGVCFVTAATLLAVRGRPDRSSSTEALVIAAGQSVFGCAALALLPAPTPNHGEPPTAWTTLTAWMLVIALVALVGIVGMRSVHRLRQKPYTSPWELVNGPGMVVVAVALSATATPPVVPWDGYHFGELVSPAYVAGTWGQLPFLDQLPARGILVNYVPSWLSDVVAAPGASLIGLGHAWLSLALVAAVYALVKGRLPVHGALLVTATTAFACSNLIAIGDVAMLLSIVLLHRIAAWRNGVAWPTGAILALVALMAAPAQGGACAACFAILLATHTLSQRPRLPRLALSLGVALALLVGALFVNPLRRSIGSAVGYVTSQGSVNDQVWGTPWLWSLEVQSQESMTAPALELLRAAVLPILAVMGALLLIQLRGERLKTPALSLSIACVAYLCLQLPRALGRIDPDGISRVGALTLVAAGIALPVLGVEAKWFDWKRVATLSVALVVTPLIIMDGGLVKAATFAGRTISTTDPTTGGIFVASGPKFGNAMIDPALRTEYLDLSEQLHQLPGSRDGLLDLTNQQSDFRYLGVSNALSYEAAYNITSRPVELRETSRLMARPPRVALLTSNLATWHDGGSFGLRTPVLYRWVLSHYTPVQCGTPGTPGFAIWGTYDGSAPDNCLRTTTEADKAAMFDRAFMPSTNLGALARSWGSQRASAITTGAVGLPEPTQASVTRRGDTIDVSISSRPAGDPRDVLALTLNCGSWTTATITWGSDSLRQGQGVEVQLGGGRALLPMGAFPSFALRQTTLKLHVQLHNTDCTGEASATWSERMSGRA